MLWAAIRSTMRVRSSPLTDMKQYDVIVIGGGVLGCFAARNLARWELSIALVEGEQDVCTGITRSNSAIVYAGYDNQPGSLKAEMTVRGNAAFERLCQELEVPFSRCGSLMVSCGEQGNRVLRKKYDNGQRSCVPGLRLISGAEARELEPMLTENVTLALHASTAGTVNPWQLGIAAFENAVSNGCEVSLGTRVQSIRRMGGKYIVETERDVFSCRAVLNCAGLNADRVQEMVFPPLVRLFPDGADFLVLDRNAPSPGQIVFYESEEKGKGITAIPTVDGNLLLGPTRRPMGGRPFATTAEGLSELLNGTKELMPGVDLTSVIRSFAAVRPNPYAVVLREGEYVPDGKSIGSFVIENPAPGFYSLLGIKTPGLTCADELGRHLADRTAEYLGASLRGDFSPHRKAITRWNGLSRARQAELAGSDPDYSEIICQCESVTRGEILEAIERGAVSVDGVKRRTGSGMGRCQGGRCAIEIARILREKGIEDPRMKCYPRGG